MKKYLILITLATLTVFPSFSNAEKLAENFSYVNHKGSKLEFNIDEETGKITGHYITALGCDKGIPAPLVGWLNKKAISFTANFGRCYSLTSWVGHIEKNGNIKTIWTLSKGESTDWNTLLTGASTFTSTDETLEK
jgi:hypothetical protein